MSISSVVITASSESTIYHVIHKSTFATCVIPPDYAAMLHITN